MNRLYRNDGVGLFPEIGATLGVDDSRNGHGTVIGDYDNDGDLVFYIVNSSTANRLYRNSGSSNRWLQIKFVGMVSNRDGIGAKTTAVTAATRQRRDMDGGSGYLSQQALPVEFGFGHTTLVDSLIIHWPSGIVQVLTDVATNQVLTVVEPNQSVIVTVNTALGAPDDTLRIPVTRTNPNTTSPIAGLQFYVVPGNPGAVTFAGLEDTLSNPGFGVLANTEDDTAPVLSDHAVGLGINSHISGGTLRVVAYGMTPGTGLPVGHDAMLHLPVSLRDGKRDPIRSPDRKGSACYP